MMVFIEMIFSIILQTIADTILYKVFELFFRVLGWIWNKPLAWLFAGPRYICCLLGASIKWIIRLGRMPFSNIMKEDYNAQFALTSLFVAAWIGFVLSIAFP